MFFHRANEFWGRGRWLATGMCMTLLVACSETDVDDGDDIDPLPGRSPEQIDALISDFDEVIETVALYGSLSSILIILLAFSLALRLRSWAAYVCLTMLSMIWLAIFEQGASGLYWIGISPGYDWLTFSGFALASLHVLLAAASIHPDNRLRVLRPFLFLSAGLLWLVLLGHSPNDISETPWDFYAVAVFASLSHLAAVPSFLSKESPTVHVQRIGQAFAIIAVLTAAGLLAFGELEEELDIVFSARLALIALIGFYVLFFVRHVLALLRERDGSIRKSMEDARRDAEKSRALLEAERNYTRAKEAARLHTMRLAAASHDIRQPIAALRSTFGAVAQDQPQEVRDQLNTAFDYLDELASSYIDDGQTENAPQPPLGQGPAGEEVVSTDIVCAMLDRMFRKEAEARHLIFEMDVEAADIRIQPLILTRILSNLLSNAIKHTTHGTVRLQAETVSEGFQFSVFNSANLPDGPEADGLFDPFVKGTESTGSGLGLSIVEDLAGTSGLRMSWASPQGEGTTFRVLVPSEQPAS